MKDCQGLFLKEGDSVFYGVVIANSSATSGTSCAFNIGVIEKIIDNKAKLHGVLAKRKSFEIMSAEPYNDWVERHPEYLI